MFLPIVMSSIAIAVFHLYLSSSLCFPIPSLQALIIASAMDLMLTLHNLILSIDFFFNFEQWLSLSGYY